MPWSTSNRKSRLPPPGEWNRLRKIVIERAGGQCEMIEDGERCTNPGRDVDHKVAMLDIHEPAALQLLCAHHHARKSSSEGRQAQLRAKREAKKRFARPVEEHPGRVAAREGFRPPDFKQL